MIQQTLLQTSRVSQNFDDGLFSGFDEILQKECFGIAEQDDDLQAIESNERLQRWISENDRFLLLGTGGSSLGARAIYEVAKCYGDWKDGRCQAAGLRSHGWQEKKRKTIEFVDNLDPCSLMRFGQFFDDPGFAEKTGVLCISKSGETLETITQLILVISEFFGKSVTKNLHSSPNFGSKLDLSSKIVVITEDRFSTLKNFALKNGFLCLDHPKNIGGRFSVLSVVGMLPAIICGANPREIRRGAVKVLHDRRESVRSGAVFVARNFWEGFKNHVAFVYSDKLAAFGGWLAQLYAESSGKNGRGINPVTARGSVDQHSQLQLYLDGPSDKCFSFFLEKQSDKDLVFAENLDSFSGLFSCSTPAAFAYLRGKRIADIFEAQSQATMSSLVEKGRPVRSFVFPEVTPEILGQLFMHFMMEVSCVCNLLAVNPFDQPAVERGKILTKELLGADIYS